jgi:hypothetical protein
MIGPDRFQLAATMLSTPVPSYVCKDPWVCCVHHPDGPPPGTYPDVYPPSERDKLLSDLLLAISFNGREPLTEEEMLSWIVNVRGYALHVVEKILGRA